MKEYIPAGNPSIDECENRSKLVSFFQNAFGGKPENRPLDDVLRAIRLGEHATPVALIRDTFQQIWSQTKDAGKAKKAIACRKKKLPVFCISGTAINRKEALVHSGYLQIDLDDLTESLPVLREKLKRDPYVAFGFVSPSGAGLKLGLRIDDERHEVSFTAAEAYFKDHYGLQIDRACKDRLRLCFVSHDPDLWTNWGATPLPIMPDTKQDIRLNPESECCMPASLHTKDEEVLANIAFRKEAQRSLLENHPNLLRLYDRFIETRFQAEAGARNSAIVLLVPFLYRAVAPEFVLVLVGYFYDCNRALFKDSREQHMREAKAMLEAVVQTYIGCLGPTESRVYATLPKQEQTAFRICRDLALFESPEFPPPKFFLSCNQFGDRLGISPTQAQRILFRMRTDGLIKELKKGQKRSAGVKGVAGTYAWQLSSSKGGHSQS